MVRKSQWVKCHLPMQWEKVGRGNVGGGTVSVGNDVASNSLLSNLI